MERIRLLVQLIWIFLTNGFWAFPLTRSIYQGPLKAICSPGLNCYSCPASTTYCPLGSLQQLFLSVRFTLQAGQFYVGAFVLGTMGMLGVVFGRFICGWACPFGLLQEMLHKIPSRKFGIYQPLRWVKYAFLALFVILLPLLVVDRFGLGLPWFCKFICPAGTFEAGIPMILLKPDLRSTLGWLFASKLTIMALFFFWAILANRPFCRTACPLGAFYGIFSKFQLIRLKLNEDACTKCKACHAVCPVDLKFNENPNSTECVNCLKCMTQACPAGAISIDVAGYTLPVHGRVSKNTITSST